MAVALVGMAGWTTAAAVLLWHGWLGGRRWAVALVGMAVALDGGGGCGDDEELKMNNGRKGYGATLCTAAPVCPGLVPPEVVCVRVCIRRSVRTSSHPHVSAHVFLVSGGMYIGVICQFSHVVVLLGHHTPASPRRLLIPQRASRAKISWPR